MPEPSSRTSVPVRIALGSNLAAPHAAVRRGWDAVVVALALTRPRLSTLLTSAPAEGASGGPFANAVGVGYTTLVPAACLAALQRVERAFGRDRAVEGHHGARPLDLDVLDWNGVRMDTTTLQLPHPRSHDRLFVLEPWAELEPGLACPCCGIAIADLAHRRRLASQPATSAVTPVRGSTAP